MATQGMERFARQIQLAEVGVHGQERLGRHAFVSPRSCTALEGRYARLYAERCGLLVSEDTPRGSFAHPDAIAQHFRHESARAVGVGAAIALSHVLVALSEERAH